MKLDENFNQQEFTDWIEEFLPDFSKVIRKVDVPGGFTGVKSINTLGVSGLNIRVYIIETDADPSKRKVGLATNSFSLLKNYGSPNAIIAYYSKDEPLWRISLLTSTPIWSEGKIITKLSNPKRQSYVLGSKAKIKTPYQFLLSKGKVIDFTDLKSRFSLEVVNKEFYKEISQAFTKLVGGSVANGKSKKTFEPLLKLPSLQDRSQTNLEFAVRLIGRIIFCWFLREKRSATGHSLIPKELVSFDAVSSTQDYYHKILEPIFFEILNKPIRSRKENFINDLFSAIPYLNGGLFSPHEDDFFSYNEGKQAINHNIVVIPDEWIKTFFEVLETYNFTIDENTSFDEELSIDPEMLGRIFENLLAEINPETGESARKSTGSYYTPRIIVDYMIDESLLLYLKEKTGVEEYKLRSLISYDLEDDETNPLNEDEKDKIIKSLGIIKILDPACGSGAFPIGALQKIVFILQQIDQSGQLWFKKQIENTPIELRKVLEREFQQKNFDYIRKLGIIRENIYGVDIQPIATEISRLRCFLTLVVDERIDDSLENRGIEPLPNLDFKFVTANSLISLPKIDTSQQAMFDDYEKIDELKRIRDQYFNASGLEREQLKTEFVMAQKRLVDQLIKEHGFMGVAKAELTQKLTDWEPFSHKTTSWFDPEWMFGIKDGFDIVIANPPYVGFHGIKDIRKQLTKDFISAKGKFDLYLIFVEKGLQLVKDARFMVYICPTNFTKRDHGEELRSLLISKSEIVEIVDFGHQQIFDSVTNYTGIFLFQKRVPTENHEIKYKKDLTSDSLVRYKQSSFNKKSWVFRQKNISTIVDKIELRKRLSVIASGISEGIVTGLNKFYLLSLEEIKANGFETTYFRKSIRGKEIKRNSINPADFFVFYPYEGEGKDMKVVDEATFSQKCPNYYHYLESNKTEIMERDYFKKSNKKWFELWNPRNISQFDLEKIVTPELSSTNNFAFAQNEFFYGDTVCGITINTNSQISLLSLLAILNSSLIEFYYKSTTVPKAGGFYIYKVMYLKDIPIAVPDELTAFKLDQLQTKLVSNNSSDIAIEKEIDSLIYSLYGLNEAEIEIVEGGINVS